MEYIIIFLEGIITFISPCLLPMLPVYVSYFAGSDDNSKSSKKTFTNTLSFVLGFTLVFTLIGVLSSSIGNIIKENRRIVDIVLGIIIIMFGINFINIINIPFINKTKGIKVNNKSLGIVSSFVFGVIFSVTWSPCTSAFLGTALSIIVINGNVLKGIFLIITYCLGLGIPFIISAVLIDKLKNTFAMIKANYKVINIICGIFLCVIGILMITGLIDKYFNLTI